MKDEKHPVMAKLATVLAPVQAANQLKTKPLSLPQQRLWLLRQAYTDDSFYNITLNLEMKGKLNMAALQQTLNEFARRHEILRTTFAVIDGIPMQQIQPSAPLPLTIVDISAHPTEEHAAIVSDIIKAAVSHQFDFATELWRSTLIRMGEYTHQLLIVIHHIIVDDLSCRLMLNEFFALYPAFAAGQPSPLPELSVQYADLVEWEQQRITPEVTARRIAYWTRQLAEVPPLTLLADRPRPKIETFRSGIVYFEIMPDVVQQLKEIAQQTNTTLFSALLSAYGIYLAQHSGCVDLVVGVPFANRKDPRSKSLFGCFFTMLLVRIDLRDQPTFLTLLARVRQTILEAVEQQEVPFEPMVQAIQQKRTQRYPLFQVAFNLLPAPYPKGVQLPDLTVSSSTLLEERDMMRLDLAVVMWKTPMPFGEGLQGWWQYKCDLFDAEQITAVIGQFQAIIRKVTAYPDRPLDRIGEQ